MLGPIWNEDRGSSGEKQDSNAAITERRLQGSAEIRHKDAGMGEVEFSDRKKDVLREVHLNSPGQTDLIADVI